MGGRGTGHMIRKFNFVPAEVRNIIDLAPGSLKSKIRWKEKGDIWSLILILK